MRPRPAHFTTVFFKIATVGFAPTPSHPYEGSILTRRALPPQPQPALLTIEQIRQAIPRLERRLAEVKAFDPTAISRHDPDSSVRGLAAAIDDTLIRTFGTGTIEYLRYCDAANYSWSVGILNSTPYDKIVAELTKAKQRSSDLLREAIRSLQERAEEVGRPRRSREKFSLFMATTVSRARPSHAFWRNW